MSAELVQNKRHQFARDRRNELANRRNELAIAASHALNARLAPLVHTVLTAAIVAVAHGYERTGNVDVCHANAPQPVTEAYRAGMMNQSSRIPIYEHQHCAPYGDRSPMCGGFPCVANSTGDFSFCDCADDTAGFFCEFCAPGKHGYDNTFPLVAHMICRSAQ